MECLLRWFIIVATASRFLVSAQYGGCSKERTDYLPGVMRGMFKSISDTECELVKNTQFQQYDPSNGEIFDYIIVGAGAAGSLLANRLSANPNVRVLLLEAGGDPNLASEVPGFAFYNFGTEIEWAYRLEPEDGLYWGRGPNGVPMQLGKGVGGGTLLNFMLYTRGYPPDYDLWSKAGNIGWSYKDLLPHFKQLENMKAEEVLSCESCMKYHGTEGEIWIETFTKAQLDPYSQIIVDGLNTMGVGKYSDYNNPEMAVKGGYFFMQGSKMNGRRFNAGKAFLKPVERRRNLRLSKHSLVTKVLINKNKEAYGVEFKNRFNESVRVLASKETILSAGGVSTPQVMMLSGVGPRKQLEDLGIQVKHHSLSVGENYQDHPHFQVVVSLDKEFKLTDKNFNEKLFEYITRSTGLMLTPGNTLGTNAMFINSGNSSTGYPNVEILPTLLDKNDTLSAAGTFSPYTQDIAEQVVTINKNKPIILFNTALLKPKSTGRITLRSSDPQDLPKIYSNFFTNKADFIPVITGIRFIERIVASKPMRDVGAKLELLDFPRCRRYPAGSDEYWECAIRHLVTTTFHSCCTMRMGPDSDNRAVVDSRLRVRGISKLRAVDLSVSPSIVSTHTQATAYVIAQKAADMIISDNVIDNGA